MKIYTNGEKTSLGKHIMMVQPGKDHKDVSSWFTEDGKPIMFKVVFNNGKAEVDDNLAKYLIDKNYASKSPIIVKSH